jgi:hypothetical protein
MDDFTSKIAVSIITELFKEAAKGVKTITNLISNSVKGQDILGLAAKKYSSNILKRYNYVRVFGMTAPISLTDIYIYESTFLRRSSHDPERISKI